MAEWDCEELIGPLLLWYENNRRDLPWRHTQDPYRIWVSEIMLQQTRVEAVIPYYNRFLEALPAVADLVSCPEEKLLKLWEGLGYYSRARNMQRAAAAIMSEHGGRLPESVAGLRRLPGIGAYTAGAIASIAFGKPEPAVDGNVLRVYTRAAADPTDIASMAFRREVAGRLRGAMRNYFSADRRHRPGDLNQAFMDLGAGICLPNTAPLCDRCPLAALCAAHRCGGETKYPLKKGKKQRKVVHRTILIIRDGDSIYIDRRPAGGLLAGMYEFPGMEGERSEQEALRFAASLGLEPLRIEKLRPARHIFSHVEWRMTAYEIRVAGRTTGGTDPGGGKGFFAEPSRIRAMYPIPSAFAAYKKYLRLTGSSADTGQE